MSPVLPKTPIEHTHVNTVTTGPCSKKHTLPLTQDYILLEYSDVFSGVGTLPDGDYHIELKDDYKPVQHAPRTVPVKFKPAYETELKRLCDEGIITPVNNNK